MDDLPLGLFGVPRLRGLLLGVKLAASRLKAELQAAASGFGRENIF